MPTLELETRQASTVKKRVRVSAAEIVALGAAVSGTITLGVNLPPKAVVVNASVFNGGTAAATLTTLTVTIGDAGDDDRYLLAQTVFLANAGIHSFGQQANTNASATADTAITCLFTGNANLSTMTGLTDGVVITVEYKEA